MNGQSAASRAATAWCSGVSRSVREGMLDVQAAWSASLGTKGCSGMLGGYPERRGEAAVVKIAASSSRLSVYRTIDQGDQGVMSARSMAMLIPELALLRLPVLITVRVWDPVASVGLVHTMPDALRVAV